ncbi:MAG: response regulator [Clostridia bacterium]|nr:response regulator [Clostridia bacterium]
MNRMLSKRTREVKIKTAVVVDDEPITCMDLTQMLQELGFEIKGSASDGFDAIDLCRKTSPDVVLMDIKMPIFDGLSASETILQEGLAGCVVLLTAFCDKEFVDRASQIGITGYLVKPIEERLLLPTIEVAMAQAERIRLAQTEANNLKQQLNEMKLIDRAKILLSQQQKITEAQAYRELQQASMQKRTPMSVVAEVFLSQNDPGDIVDKAKAILIKQEGLTEAAAYRRVVEFSKGEGGDMGKAARKIIEESIKD